MNQSNPNFEVPEVSLPPEPPPEEDPMEVKLTINQIWSWEAIREFPTWEEALKWSGRMRTEGGPKYLVRKIDTDHWEAIQAWMRSF